MTFVKPKSKITLTVPASEDEAKAIESSLATIVNKCSPKELALLAKAVSSPLIKTAALAELKKRFPDS